MPEIPTLDFVEEDISKIHTSDVVINDLSNMICHILAPRNIRNNVKISLPSHVPPSSLCSVISPALKQTMDSSYIEILEITQGLPSENNTTYTVIFLNIPNELIDKLRYNGIKKCIFYVGLSENVKEFPVLDTAPPIDILAITNREGNPSLYMSKIITISS